MEWDGSYHAPKEHTTIDRLCAVIRSGDMVAFTDQLGDIDDLDAQGGQLLLTCVEADQYLMAKKLLLRGADSFIVERKIDKEFIAVSEYARLGRKAKTEADIPRFNQLRVQKNRLAIWKKEVAEYAASVGTLQKIETLEEKIDALRAMMAEMTATRTPSPIKKAPAGPHR